MKLGVSPEELGPLGKPFKPLGYGWLTDLGELAKKVHSSGSVEDLEDALASSL